MAILHHSPATPSPSASRLLHPAAPSTPAAPASPPVGTDVLAEIAAGLARTVTPGAVDGGRTVLLVTPAYEAAVETVEAEGCQMVDSAGGLPVSFALVVGELIAWTADDGSEVLTPGALCSIGGGERVQLANVGPVRAVLVSVRARLDGQEPDAAAFAPCAAAVA